MSQFETLCKALEGLQSQAEVPGAGALAPGVGRATSHRLFVSGSQLLTGKYTNVFMDERFGSEV